KKEKKKSNRRQRQMSIRERKRTDKEEMIGEAGNKKYQQGRNADLEIKGKSNIEIEENNEE
ncbi:hypothetical protein, partial [Staphylococcus aureus]|uniref:hypothetical protein n=1 Tax=Staphylococcus aureus TaxID=1280 RepID=UPI000A25D2B0